MLAENGDKVEARAAVRMMNLVCSSVKAEYRSPLISGVSSSAVGRRSPCLCSRGFPFIVVFMDRDLLYRWEPGYQFNLKLENPDDFWIASSGHTLLCYSPNNLHSSASS